MMGGAPLLSHWLLCVGHPCSNSMEKKLLLQAAKKRFKRAQRRPKTYGAIPYHGSTGHCCKSTENHPKVF
jgi:hypothetical protein